MSNKTQLLIMAAGIGSRYGGLKQIDAFGPNGEIVIDYSIYDAIKAGFEKVVFVITREIEDAFKEKIGRHIGNRVETATLFQELDNIPAGFTVPAERKKPWGTGHAVLCARSAIDGPCAVINADDFYGPDSFRMLHQHLKEADDTDGIYDYSMVGYILKNTVTEHGHVARGICTAGSDHFLETIVERTKIQKFGEVIKFTEDDSRWEEIDAESIVSMNMWGFTPSLFDELEERFKKFLSEKIKNIKAEYFVPTVVNELIQEGKARVKILPTKDTWFGVTYKEDRPVVKEAIHSLISKGVYPTKLWG